MKKSDEGFSLIELIVVIVILAILIGVTIGGVYKWVGQARKNTDIQNCESLESAIFANVVSEGVDNLGEPYSWVCVAYFNEEERGNLFINSYCFSDSVASDSTALDWSKFEFERAVNKSFEGINESGNSPLDLKAGGQIFITVACDENGAPINCKVGILNKTNNWGISRGHLYNIAYLYNPLLSREVNPNAENSLSIILYDGVNKFYE